MNEEYLLLIWDERFRTSLYCIPTLVLSEDDLKLLESAQNNLVNIVDDEEAVESIIRIDAAIADKKHPHEEELFNDQWATKWSKYLVNPKDIKGPITKVILTGWID
jgi:hypothetical protein